MNERNENVTISRRGLLIAGGAALSAAVTGVAAGNVQTSSSPI